MVGLLGATHYSDYRAFNNTLLGSYPNVASAEITCPGPLCTKETGALGLKVSLSTQNVEGGIFEYVPPTGVTRIMLSEPNKYECRHCLFVSIRLV
jgi:hypothetical protein